MSNIDGNGRSMIFIIPHSFSNNLKAVNRLFIGEKITETVYDQLHSEWQEKMRNLELSIAELEREPKLKVDDLDMALVLLTKVGELYLRLDEKQKSTLLQMLVKKIVVNDKGEIVDYELHAPFVYLRSLVDGLSVPESRELAQGMLDDRDVRLSFLVSDNLRTFVDVI